MPISDLSLMNEWFETHPQASRLDIHHWTHLAGLTDTAYWIGFDFEDWLSSDRTGPVPDLVKYISLYGYISLRLQTWKLPIELSAPELKRWRKAGYFVELRDFQNALASVAGGFLHLAGQEPALTVDIIQQQLSEKLAELQRRANRKLEEAYTPEFLESQVREDFATSFGLKGRALDEAVLDVVLSGEDHGGELERFEMPFTLRQQLECFAWGMKKFRLLTLSEHEPELGLPNQELYDLLMKIDLDQLIGEFNEVDPKLRRIWQHLASYNCYELNADYEPEQFWWRHWKSNQHA